MVEMATRRRAERSDRDASDGAVVIDDLEGSSNAGESGGDGATPRNGGKRRKRDHGAHLSGDLASFGETIYASDDAQVSVEKSDWRSNRNALRLSVPNAKWIGRIEGNRARGNAKCAKRSGSHGKGSNWKSSR